MNNTLVQTKRSWHTFWRDAGKMLSLAWQARPRLSLAAILLSLVQALARDHPALAPRAVLLSETSLVGAPTAASVLTPPIRRRELLEALGRKVRRR